VVMFQAGFNFVMVVAVVQMQLLDQPRPLQYFKSPVDC
jgi:hypothetical protein